MLWTEFPSFRTSFYPWSEFEGLEREMDRLLSARVGTATREFPLVNVWTGEDEAVVTTEIPGVDPNSVDISVAGKVLTIRGSRDPEKPADGESYHRRERWSGQFSKTFELPFNIEAGKVQARFRKGVLYILLPRAEAEKPRKITVSAE